MAAPELSTLEAGAASTAEALADLMALAALGLTVERAPSCARAFSACRGGVTLLADGFGQVLQVRALADFPAGSSAREETAADIMEAATVAEGAAVEGREGNRPKQTF